MIWLYFTITLAVSLGIFSAFSSFIPEKDWEIFPEYGTYIIPTVSISMLLLYRILDLVEKNFELLLPQVSSKAIIISSKEIKNIISDIIIGLLVLSLVTFYFAGTGINKNVLEFDLFVLLSSIIVAFIELSVWYFKNYFQEEFYKYQTSYIDMVKEREKSQKKFENIIHKHPKLVYFIWGACILAFLLLVYLSPHTTQVCSNTTLLDVNVTEISTDTNETSINETNAIIPLVIIDGKQKPLTERINYIRNLVSYEQLNKTLDVSSKKVVYPLMIKREGIGSNSPNATGYLKNSLNCYPPDYDATIIFALYSNGYPNFKLACSFQDYGTMVFANKIFFNLNNKSNIAIFLHITGATYSVTEYRITIMTLNETMGENIKVLLEEDRKKANIVIINEDPIKSIPFNCSI